MRLGSTAVFNELIQVYPEHEVVEQLEQLYRMKIRQVIGELEVLLQQYQLCANTKIYEQEQAKVMFIEASESEGTMGVQTLETSLKRLLEQRGRIKDALFASFGS